MTAGVRRVAESLPEDELLDLVRRCRAADGGMPLVTEPWFLRGRWLAAGTVAFEVREDGTLVAAAAVRPSPGGPMISGLVDPAFRGRGVGASLLDTALAAAADPPVVSSAGPSAVSSAGPSVVSSADPSVVSSAGPPAASSAGPSAAGAADRSAVSFADSSAAGAAGLSAATFADSAGIAVGDPSAGPLVGPSSAAPAADVAAGAGSSGSQREVSRGAPPVTVECEGLTAGAAELFASRGLTQFFGEDVMRIKLASADGFEAGWPDGAEVVEWSAETAGRFHAVYAASFRDRPGFPDPAAEEWIEENTEDDDFRPQWSLMVALPEHGDVGFVTAAEGWIVQVGVVPAARGTGLGGALIRESLRRMAAAGATEAWLTVNVNNPTAAGLYRKLGFDVMGQRARYR